MFTMEADGVVFHDLSLNDATRAAFEPEATLEFNKPGSLTFTLPPDNVLYRALTKRKSVVTLYQDGEILFRGRVLDTTTDLYNLNEVYCEGELALLLDSVQLPGEYTGTARGYLAQMISQHNAQMDADKQFVLGEVTAVTDDDTVEVDTSEYRETLSEMRSLLVDEFGGYLRVRYAGGTRYLDYIAEYAATGNQKIQFGVNLVDIETRNDTADLFTVLLPLGKAVSGKYLTVEEVNGGSIYLEDSAAVAQYRRIVKTKRFEKVEDPEELLALGQQFLAQARAQRSIAIRAVDMKILDPEADGITLGDHVLLDSSPHGLAETEICKKAVLNISAPDQSEYYFGMPPETMTGNYASSKKKLQGESDKLKEWLSVTDDELKLQKQWISETGDVISNVLFEMDAMNATIRLKADQTVVSDLETRVSNAEILIDGANAAIDLKADRTTVTDLETRMSAAEILIDGANAKIELKAAQSEVDAISQRLSQAEIDIDGANAQISLKASQSTVDELGERVSSAEIKIDGANSSIELLAEEIRLAGYVTADELDAAVSDVENAYATYIMTNEIDAGTGEFGTLIVSGSAAIPHGSFGTVEIGGTSFDPADYATQAWVEEQGYLTSATMSNYATQSWVIEQGYATSADVAETLTGFVMQGELDGYATETWVEAQGYLTEIPTGYATEAWVTENFSKASATYKPTAIERYGSLSGTSIPVQALNEAGTVLLTGTVDAGDVYTNGKNGVTLSAAGWQGGSNVVSASNGKSVTVSLPSFSVSGGDSFNSSHQTTVYFYTGSVSGPLASKTVDASSVYDAGYAAAAVEDIVLGTVSYNASSKIYFFPITVTSANGTTKQESFGISATAAYDSGYDAGYAAGQAAGGSTSISLVWTAGSGTYEYVVMAIDGDGNILATTTKDFTDVYDTGHDAGYQAAKDGLTMGKGAMTIQNTAPNYMYASTNAYAYIDGELIKSIFISGSQKFDLGQ